MSFVGGIRNVVRRILEGSLSSEPIEGAAKNNLTRGCIIVFALCLSLAFGGLFLQVNIFLPLTGLFAGLSILLSGAADLAFERQGELAVRLRLFRLAALVLSWVSLVAAIIKDWGDLVFFLKG